MRRVRVIAWIVAVFAGLTLLMAILGEKGFVAALLALYIGFLLGTKIGEQTGEASMLQRLGEYGCLDLDAAEDMPSCIREELRARALLATYRSVQDDPGYRVYQSLKHVWNDDDQEPADTSPKQAKAELDKSQRSRDVNS